MYLTQTCLPSKGPDEKLQIIGALKGMYFHNMIFHVIIYTYTKNLLLTSQQSPHDQTGL